MQVVKKAANSGHVLFAPPAVQPLIFSLPHFLVGLRMDYQLPSSFPNRPATRILGWLVCFPLYESYFLSEAVQCNGVMEIDFVASVFEDQTTAASWNNIHLTSPACREAKIWCLAVA